MSDNGHEEERVKECPFLMGYCIKERCALFTGMRQVGGLQGKFGMCSFNAMIMMLSEMNMKTPSPQQKIQIPQLLRG